VSLTARQWLVLQVLVMVVLVVVMLVGLAGFSFRLLGLPWVVWNFTLPGVALLIDGRRRQANAREQREA
jgi:hypothetical protein